MILLAYLLMMPVTRYFSWSDTILSTLKKGAIILARIGAGNIFLLTFWAFLAWWRRRAPRLMPWATVSRAGGWAYTWAQLPKYEGGKEIVYTVEEVKVPLGYVGRQRQVGPNEVQLINMIPEVPKTGDDGNMGTHMLLMALSMAGLMVALNQYKKRAKTGMK